MSIVCGTDFSTNTAAAVDTAVAISKQLKVPLQLLHVVLSARALPDNDPRRQELARAADVLRAQGAEVHEAIVNGQPEEQLSQKAKTAKLLVVGALGHQTAARGQIGNVAAKTSQICQTPVLVVREARPFQEWAGGLRPLKVILAADGSPPAKIAAQWLAELKAIGPIEVIAVHLYDVQTELQRLGIPGVTDFVTPNEQAEKVLQREMLDRCKSLEIADQLNLRIEPKGDDVAEQIVKIAAEENADLIVVGAHQRRGLTQLWYGSISQAILQLANTAVASVPLTYQVQTTKLGKLPKMQSALVPTDLTLGSPAIPYAYSTVGTRGLVYILHIVKAPPDREVKDRDALESKLKAMIPPQALNLQIETKLEIIHSVETAEAICQAAERLGVDAICMASHGHSGIMQRVMGATAQEVLEKSKKPLLVIRAEA
jgi:nucleotide-binding universal stress UspA family protein